MRILDIIKGKVTLQTSTTKALGSKTLNAFEVIDSSGAGLFEVRENGDTVIAGVLTVNGTGTSTFAGDVSIGGALNVANGTTAQANMSGENLTLTGNLTVHGNTVLGDNATADTTTIKGVTTVVSKTTKALGSSTVDAFKVIDSAGASLFNVKENGDTVIGGVLTVNGTGTSTFAGDVNIGGALTVAEGATVNAGLAGNDLTLTGNLVVKGNTTLGDATSDIINVNGTVTLPSTTTIGGTTHASIASAVSNSHTRNADLGTTSQTFYIGSTGVKIKNNGGTELQIRNNGDTSYADLRIKNLYVEGTQTVIKSNEVSIGDNEIVLNDDITTSATNSDGGIAVKRLLVDNVTRADAKMYFNNSTGRWETVGGAITSLVTAPVAVKLTATVGNGTNDAFVLTHNLGTRDLSVTVRENASPYELVHTTVKFTTDNTITVEFATPPASNAYTVTIIG